VSPLERLTRDQFAIIVSIYWVAEGVQQCISARQHLDVFLKLVSGFHILSSCIEQSSDKVASN
jgi:hypothetical protein